MRRMLASAALLMMVGCGSDKVSTLAVGTTRATVSPAETTPPSVVSATTPVATNPSPTSAEVNPLDGAAFCAFLEQDVPALQAAGSAAGALAQFAGDFGAWLDEHPDQKPRTAADLDAASSPTCPDVQAQAVSAMGAASFNDALS
ncbi:MAG: hypothetical protein ABI706_20935 [Ilumatobacteraceae bacterium]